MSNKILVTDSLFIFDEHVKQLEAAGYEVERLDKPQATEDELCTALKGKVGYILGGVEKVTDKAIDAADELKAIVFTGIGYKAFIPSWQYATEKGIAIANVPYGSTDAVAEWAVMAASVMNRGIFDLGTRTGDKNFLTTQGLQKQNIGIIALGRIGKRIAELLQPFKSERISYYSTHRHKEEERSLGLVYEPDLYKLLEGSDVVFLGLPDEAGEGAFSKKELASMKQGALLVSFVHEGIINSDSLYEAVSNNHIRAISDWPVDSRFAELPLNRRYSFKISNAYNTTPALQYSSDAATQSLINLLKTGKDKDRVN